MKHQYFGDEKDYLTYGLLRILAQTSQLRLGIVWMLTPDRPNGQGELRKYLQRAARWRDCDPQLFDLLAQVGLPGRGGRGLHLAAEMQILPGAAYFSESLPADAAGRQGYFARLFEDLRECDVLFFDPDNGLETRSTPQGKRRSLQHLYWDELDQAYHRRRCSLVVFQHFPRRQRDAYLREQAQEISLRLPDAQVSWYQAAQVAFFCIARPEHAAALAGAPARVHAQWQHHLRSGRLEVSASPMGLNLQLLDGLLAVCRLDAQAALPSWPAGPLTALTRTPEELSVVCSQESVPAGVPAERGWRALKVAGPLDFGLTGILAALAAPLAQAGVSIFALSTYDTDYLLVKEAALERALAALRSAGHRLG